MASSTRAAHVRAFKKSVKDSITSKYATLREALRGPMELFSQCMFQAHLIDRETMRGLNYDDIIGQFLSGMEFIHSKSELQEHCRLFIDVLEKLGGAAKMASSEFTKEWNTLLSQPSQQSMYVVDSA